MVFVDETGFSFRAKTGTTWAPRGHTPILRRVSKRRELSTVIALTLSGKIDKRHFEHAIGATDMLIALKHFQWFIARPMIVIWDRLNAHRAVIVQGRLRARRDDAQEREASLACALLNRMRELGRPQSSPVS